MEKVKQLIKDIRGGKIEFCRKDYTQSLDELKRDKRDIEQFARDIEKTINKSAKEIKVLDTSTKGYEVTLRLFIGRG